MTAILLDTHALLWWLTDDPSLSPLARSAIATPGDDAFVSAASVWEIAIKRSLGKLRAPDDLFDLIGAEGFSWLPVSAEHAWAEAVLPLHHSDPFDRWEA